MVGWLLMVNCWVLLIWVVVDWSMVVVGCRSLVFSMVGWSLRVESMGGWSSVWMVVC